MAVAVKAFIVFWYMVAHIPVILFYDLFLKSKAHQKMVHHYIKWSRWVLKAYRVELHLEGENYWLQAKAQSKGPFMIISNHQSQLDIPALALGLQEALGFVAKKELGRIPVLAFWMRRVGCVLINRKNPREAHHSLMLAAKKIYRNPVVIFPEGTRSKTGRIGPLKPGAFHLAQMAQAELIPVRLEHTRAAFENKGLKFDDEEPWKNGFLQAKMKIYPPIRMDTLPKGKAGLLAIQNHIEQLWGLQPPSN